MADMTWDIEKLLIISDAHLTSKKGAKTCSTEESLIEVLEYCTEHSIRVLFLGDIFDYWMEYPGFVPPISSAFRIKLAEFIQKSSPVIMITGNHDNWTRDYFPSIGVELLHEQLFLKLDKKSILFLHGDGLSDLNFNFPRPLFHRLIRHPLFIRFYQRTLPKDYGLRLMKWFSTYSRKTNRTDTALLDNQATKWIKQRIADVVIAGHDHVARRLDVDGGIYLNSGSFHSDRTAILYTNGDFKHVKWEHNHFVSYVYPQ